MKKTKVVCIILISAAFAVITKAQDMNKFPNVFSTYIGGKSGDRANAIAMDKDGYIYISGFTTSPDFPVTPGAYCTQFKGALDGYVVKIDPKQNKIVWATYMGGSKTDFLSDMVLDDEGNVYIIGNTQSRDFPLTKNAFDTVYHGTKNAHGDLYITKLSNDGSKLIYSTFLGGRESESFEGLTIDKEGCAYICSSTSSPDYPVTNGSFDTSFNGPKGYLADVAISKLSKDGGKLAYSFFLGGRGNEIGKILKDSNGNIVIVGETSSKNFPVTNGTQFTNSDTTFGPNKGNMYITVIDPTGKNLLFSTFLGGTKGNWPNGIIIDEKDNLFITGTTVSSDFPVNGNAYQKERKGKEDAFILKYSLKKKRIEYATFIGGTMMDAGTCLLIDTKGNIVLTGNTMSPDFPVIPNALDTSYHGSKNTPSSIGGDYFISVLNPKLGKLIYSTYMGGTGDDYWPTAIIDKNNNLFIVGSTKSSDFPVTTNAINTVYGGGNNHGGDAVLIKLSLRDLMKHKPS